MLQGHELADYVEKIIKTVDEARKDKWIDCVLERDLTLLLEHLYTEAYDDGYQSAEERYKDE